MPPPPRRPTRRHDHLRLGADGEAVVERWYAERGYRVLARNWRCPDGELDLVLERDGVVVVCEVKTRASTRFGTPFEAVGPRKQARLRRVALRWLQQECTSRPDEVRFDVAGVVSRRVEVIEAAF